jgi:hypothetical protein
VRRVFFQQEFGLIAVNRAQALADVGETETAAKFFFSGCDEADAAIGDGNQQPI